MKRLLVICAVAFAFSLVAGTASAQVRPSPIYGNVCDTAQYDENADGVFGKADIMLYIQRLQRIGCWESSADGVCAQHDLNGDGTVDRSDLQVRIDFFYSCVRQPSVTRPRPGGL